MSLSAPELYAHANGIYCVGSEQCHWCAAPCEQRYIHNDDPILPFVRRTFTAKKPSGGWICMGCFLFLAPRITIQYLHGGFKDGQSPKKQSWWITRSESKVLIKNESAESLYPILLDPPRCFVLALLDDTTIPNNLHQAVANEPEELNTGTLLQFTLNNIIHTYTVYELREALISGGKTGKEPGVQALIRWLGPYTKLENTEKRDPGRPIKVEADDGKRSQAVIAQSGGITKPWAYKNPASKPRR